MITTNETYRAFLKNIIDRGERVTCRGLKTIEMLGNTAVIDIKDPLVTISARRLGYRFACAEAAWILGGENRVESMRPYSRMIGNFSDDGLYFAGAYGPRIVDQLPYVIDAFKKDLFTRQAVITIWRERPYPSKDIPCTISVQFLVRAGRLHVIDCMRSSDAWLGVPYDWFNFSMLGLFIASLLNELEISVDLLPGNLYFHAASSHLYEEGFGYNICQAINVINDDSKDPFDLGAINDFLYPLTTSKLIDYLLFLAKKEKSK